MKYKTPGTEEWNRAGLYSFWALLLSACLIPAVLGWGFFSGHLILGGVIALGAAGLVVLIWKMGNNYASALGKLCHDHYEFYKQIETLQQDKNLADQFLERFRPAQGQVDIALKNLAQQVQEAVEKKAEFLRHGLASQPELLKKMDDDVYLGSEYEEHVRQMTTAISFCLKEFKEMCHVVQYHGYSTQTSWRDYIAPKGVSVQVDA